MHDPDNFIATVAMTTTAATHRRAAALLPPVAGTLVSALLRPEADRISELEEETDSKVLCS